MLVTNILDVTQIAKPTKIELTRERITSSAIALFLDKGFDETTVAEIAAAAGVSEMTFFRYFKSKDSVVVDDPYDPFIASAIAIQPLELAPVVRAARGIREAWGSIPEPGDARTRDRIRVAANTPSLQAAMWTNNAATGEFIANQLVADGADPLASRVAASACLGALMAALLDWSQTEEGSLGDRVRFALKVLEGEQ